MSRINITVVGDDGEESVHMFADTPEAEADLISFITSILKYWDAKIDATVKLPEHRMAVAKQLGDFLLFTGD